MRPIWNRIERWFADAGHSIYRRRTALLAFGAGALTGVLLTTLAMNGWPEPGDDGLHGDVLVVLSGRDDSVGGQRQRLIDTWNALHPDRKARIQVLSASADDQLSQMRLQAQSSDSDIDVFNLDVTWTAEFAADKYIRPLKGIDETGFLEKPLQTCRYENELWALPFNTDAGLLFYRPARLRQAYSQEEWDRIVNPTAHPPAWDGIRSDIDAVFRTPAASGPPLKAGYTGQFDDYEGLTVNAMEAVWEAGGQVVDSHGRVALGSDAARRGILALAQGFADDRIILPAARRQQEADSTQSFQDGQVLFMRNWPVAYRQLTQPRTDPDPQNPDNAFGVTTLPGPSALGGQNLAVASKSKHPEAARELIQFLTGEASQQVLFQDGGLASTRLRTYKDPQVTRTYPYASTLLTSIRDAELRPLTPYYSLFSATFRRVVNAALDHDGEITDDQLRQLQRALKGKQTQ
jgi:multiple sugar transport system substrate-binding protein